MPLRAASDANAMAQNKSRQISSTKERVDSRDKHGTREKNKAYFLLPIAAMRETIYCARIVCIYE